MSLRNFHKISTMSPDMKRKLSTDDEHEHEEPSKKARNDVVDGDVFGSGTFNNLLPAQQQNASQLSTAAQRMMAKMGYKEGKGLGKHEQGISTPIAAVANKSTRGLGLTIKGLEPGTVKWNFEEEQIVIEEEVDWIKPQPPSQTLIEYDTLVSWRVIGKKKLTIDDETHFCDPEILQQVLEAKSIFDNLEDKELQSARTRSNPFETIGRGIFLNRAAMKLANIDAVLGFSLTEPKTQKSNEPSSAIAPGELLYFADVCAGPGGFSEYVLWKKQWEAKGFGFTLKGECDFKIGDFYSGPPESFEAYYGPNDDGDVYSQKNVQGFINYVKKETDGRGVHFMVADGGFSVEGQENIQEILSQRLYLSQFVIALGIVRESGHFVCKLFDIFTPFSVGLIYLMYLSFDLISIHKPNTSRPANSERYIICKWKRDNVDRILQYLLDCHRVMEDLGNKLNNTESILELVPLDTIKQPGHDFFQYIINSNNVIGERQIQNLKKIAAFARDENLFESRQQELRLKCLEFWKVPCEIRKKPQLGTASTMFQNLRGGYPDSFIATPEKEFLPKDIPSIFRTPYDWRCVLVEGGKNKKNRGYYLSLGKSNIFKFDGFEWTRVDVKFQMSKNTLVFGEIVYELFGKFPDQDRVATFHIIDALVLGGKDIRAMHFCLRHDMCVKFAKAMCKGCTRQLAPVKVKELIRMESIAEVLEKLSYQRVKAEGPNTKLVGPVDHFRADTSPNIQPCGVLFLKITREPWMMALSRSQNRKYWFNSVTAEAKFEIPEGAIPDFSYTMYHRHIWWWDQHTSLTLTDHVSNGPQSVERVHADILLKHIHHVMTTKQ